jgi:hypothetical protein
MAKSKGCPDHPAMTSLADAVALHQQGRLSEAQAAYGGVPAEDPDQPDAHVLLGVVCILDRTYRLDVRSRRSRIFRRPSALRRIAPPFASISAMRSVRRDSHARRLALRPHDIALRFNTAFCRLLPGDMVAGWLDFEYRRATS